MTLIFFSMTDVQDLPSELVRVQREMGSFFDDPIPRNLSKGDIARRRALYQRELSELQLEIRQVPILSNTDGRSTSCSAKKSKFF